MFENTKEPARCLAAVGGSAIGGALAGGAVGLVVPGLGGWIATFFGTLGAVGAGFAAWGAAGACDEEPPSPPSGGHRLALVRTAAWIVIVVGVGLSVLGPESIRWDGVRVWGAGLIVQYAVGLVSLIARRNSHNEPPAIPAG